MSGGVDRSRRPRRRPRAFATDVRRTITGSPKRFISLFIITALGAAMLVGLRAACDDLLASADAFFDAQNLMDVSVRSKIGLTGADIGALGALEGVGDAEGGYTEQAYTDVAGTRESVDIKALSEQGINRPRVLKGSLPRAGDEAAVTEKYVQASGLDIGESVTFDAGRSGERRDGSAEVSGASDTGETVRPEVFERRSYRITAVVLDPMDVNAGGKTMAFRTAAGAKYAFFLSRAAVRDPSIYTVAYLIVSGARELPCYSDAYRSLIDRVRRRAAAIRAGREAARAEIAVARDRLDQAPAQIAVAREQPGVARKRIDDGREQVADGLSKLSRNRADLAAQRDKAEARLSRASRDLDDLDGTVWYIQDRTVFASYASVDSDASSIGAIATVFPVIFFIVAVLISLTTVTRLVEEQRGLIGLYKALGYSRCAIFAKYLCYALAASLAGGLVGDFIGLVILPEVIFTIFASMYALPGYGLGFSAVYALLGIVFFATGIVGAAFLACRHELRESPAQLMRPRAPRAGQRIMLERIAPLWRRMGFLSKVTARNLLRYKRRFFMTTLGIAGCMALMVCGLGIRDTVLSFKPRQYGPEGISRYDLMAVIADVDWEQARDQLDRTDGVRDKLGLRIDSVSATFQGASESVQIMVVPDGSDLTRYVRLTDMSGAPQRLPADGQGALITKNAQQVLGFHLGDEIGLRDSALRQGDVRIAGVTLNYLGNYVFMTKAVYEDAFGVACAPNAFLAHLSGSVRDQIRLADDLADNKMFHSVVSTAKISTGFSQSFKIIDVVVYVVSVMAAALAFAVVFTLTNTNISERERELATIKVLGFRRFEVRRYINRETIILTLAGIALGCPLGYAITRLLAHVLRMPSLFFDTIVAPQTYLIAGGLSLAFTLIVNAMTNRSLDRIDMVGALKSAE